MYTTKYNMMYRLVFMLNGRLSDGTVEKKGHGLHLVYMRVYELNCFLVGAM